MIDFENTVHIGRPVEEVFRFIANFENMPKWNYYVIEVRQLSAGPVDIGTTYHQVRKDDEQQYQVVEYQPNESVAVQTLPPAPALTMRFTFEANGAGTRLVEAWQLETGLIKPLELLAKGRVQSAVAKNMQKLKELLETGQVQLQDGRVERL